jgi:hypothetical protein
MRVKARAPRITSPARPPRLRIVADDATLTPFGGSAVVGELVRRLGLIPALDGAIADAARAGGLAPVKVRRRGASPGQLLVAMADAILLGGDAASDIERLRRDQAGAELRAVAEVPAASTCAQLARRFDPAHLVAAEAALAACTNAFDQQVGRSPDEAVTLDFDSTLVEVYGRRKPGADRAYTGQLAYQPLICAWAERGRILAADLLSGSQSTRGGEPVALLGRALTMLPTGHGPVRARFDAGFYAAALLEECRARGVRFSISVPRSSAMWRALEGVPEGAWQPAEGLKDAEVAETAYTPGGWRAAPLRLIIRRVRHRSGDIATDPRARRRRTIPAAQLALVQGGAQAAYGYSFILTDLEGPPAQVERHHRLRAQVEERIKDAKLGVSLRHLPFSDEQANRVWLFATQLALNLLAVLSDLMFGPDPPGHLPRRRQAKFVRHRLLAVPARVVHHARMVTLRLPAALGGAALGAFRAAYAAARGLGPPLSA